MQYSCKRKFRQLHYRRNWNYFCMISLLYAAAGFTAAAVTIHLWLSVCVPVLVELTRRVRNTGLTELKLISWKVKQSNVRGIFYCWNGRIVFSIHVTSKYEKIN